MITGRYMKYVPEGFVKSVTGKIRNSYFVSVGFRRVKILFHADKTLVSCRENFSFMPTKLLFRGKETSRNSRRLKTALPKEIRFAPLFAIWVTLLSGFGLTSCIENDIPYPIISGDILGMSVEGQIGSATIDKKNRTVALEVSDSVLLDKLRITQLKISQEATLIVDSTRCIDYAKFPATGFVSLDSIPKRSDTRMDFTSPVAFLLKTYQDYAWKVSVKQTINREIDVENMYGTPVIDAESRQVIIYIAKGKPLNNVKVNKMNLGGSKGKVVPDPTKITDFTTAREFTVYTGGQTENGKLWKVYIYNATEEGGGSATSPLTVFAMTGRAVVSGSIDKGTQPTVEYKETASATWLAVPPSSVQVNGTAFTATIPNLEAQKPYVCRVSNGGKTEEASFTTAVRESLPNGGFEQWSYDTKNSKLVYPWADGGTPFWDTGNKGAVTVGNSNSVPTNDAVKGTAAKLESKYIVIKFAAGNIFAGEYLRTDGTDGVLSFGRSFKALPTSLKFQYKYSPQIINRVDKDKEFGYLEGRMDSCSVYIALTDWSAPMEIRTKKKERELFDKNDPGVIAYGEFVSGASQTTYVEKEIKLEYRSTKRTPKYIVLVATSSKYGDYFTGGEGSTLWLDELELIYN